MGWPQIVWACLTVLGLGVALGKHGEQSEHNFWYSLIGAGISVWLLFSGGFFH